MHRLWEPVIQYLFARWKPKNIVLMEKSNGALAQLLGDFSAEQHAVLHVLNASPAWDVAEWKKKYGETVRVYRNTWTDALPQLEHIDTAILDGDPNWYTAYHALQGLRQSADIHKEPFPLVMVHYTGWPYARRDAYPRLDSVPNKYRHPNELGGIVRGAGLPQKNEGLNTAWRHAVVEGGERNGVLTAIEDFIKACPQEISFQSLPVLMGVGVLCAVKHRKTNKGLDNHLRNIAANLPMASILSAVEQDRVSRMLVGAAEALSQAPDTPTGQEAEYMAQQEAELASARQALQDAHTQLANAQEELAAAFGQETETKAECERLKAAVAAAEAKAAAAVQAQEKPPVKIAESKPANAEELAWLKTDLKTAQQRYDDECAESKRLENQLQALYGLVHSADARRKEAEERQRTAQQQKNAAEQELSQTRTTLEQANAELHGYAEALENATRELEAIPALQTQAEELRTEIMRLDGQIEAKSKELEAADEREQQYLLWQRNLLIAVLLEQREQKSRHVRQMLRLVEAQFQESKGFLHSLRWRIGDRCVRLIELAMLKGNSSKSSAALQNGIKRYEAWKNTYAEREKQRTPRSAYEQHQEYSSAEEMDKALHDKDELIAKIRDEIMEREESIAYLINAFGETSKLLGNLRRSTRWRAGLLIMGLIETFTPRRRVPGCVARMEDLQRHYEHWTMVYKPLALDERAELPPPHARHTPSAPLEPAQPVAMPEIDANVMAWLERGVSPPRIYPKAPLLDIKAPRCRDAAAYRVRLTQFTPAKTRNPFYAGIPETLKSWGWKCEYTTDWNDLAVKAKSRHFAREIIHFHQLDPLYHSKTGDLEETRRNASTLIGHLKSLKDAGAVLVWTKHNPYPHNRRYFDIDQALIREAAGLMDRIVVLGSYCRNMMKEYADPQKIIVLPHQSYDGFYGPRVSRETARERLGLDPERFIFGNLGEIRPYKGLETLIEATQRLAGESPNGKAPMLLISGKPGPPDYVERIKSAASEHVVVHAQEIADADMPVWLGAMDAAVFAFKDIWMSGSLILAMSYGVPPLVPNIGALSEYVHDEDTGFQYRHEDTEHLVERMSAMQHSPLLEHMRYMCGVFAKKNTIQQVARTYADLYLGAAGI